MGKQKAWLQGRVALEEDGQPLLYHRYETVDELVGLATGSKKRKQQEQADDQQADENLAAGNSNKQSKREKKKKKSDAAAEAQQPEEQQQQQEEADAEPPSTSKKAKKEKKKKQQGESAEAQAEDQQQPAAVTPAAKGNADEAQRIRETLGYAGAAAAAPAAAPAAAGGSKAFSFSFAVAKQVEDETQAKLNRIMLLDSSKDGYVPRRVWICGMPHEYSEDDIREYWGYCGEVEALDCLTFPGTTRFNGVCFITFKTQEAYESALACNGEELEGRTLRVEKCKIIAPRKGAAAGQQHQQQAQPQQDAGAVEDGGAYEAEEEAEEAAAEDNEGKAAGRKGRPSQQERRAAAQQRAGAAAEAAAPAAPAAGAAAAASELQRAPGYNVAYAGNIAYEASDEDLMQLFKPFGVKLVRLHTDKDTGKSKGYAHVHFPDGESLDKAVSKMNGAWLHGRKIKVSYGQPKKQ